MGYLPEHLDPFMSQDETRRVRRYKRMMLASVDDVRDVPGGKKMNSARRRRQQMMMKEREEREERDGGVETRADVTMRMTMSSMTMIPDFVDGRALTAYLTERGGMQPRRRTGFKVAEQRKLKREVRIARQMGVLAADRKLPHLMGFAPNARGRRAAAR